MGQAKEIADQRAAAAPAIPAPLETPSEPELLMSGQFI